MVSPVVIDDSVSSDSLNGHFHTANKEKACTLVPNGPQKLHRLVRVTLITVIRQDLLTREEMEDRLNTQLDQTLLHFAIIVRSRKL